MQTAPKVAPVQRQQTVWMAFILLAVLIVTAGLFFRAAIAARFMPMIDHYDESLLFLQAYQLRPDAAFRDIYWEIPWNDGFPRIQLWLGVLTQQLVERQLPFPNPSDYILAMRYVSVGAGVITLIALMLTGWQIGQRGGMVTAGVGALWIGMLWGFTPQILDTSSFALMDPLILPSLALATLFCVLSIRHDSAVSAFVSLAFAILAIYTKYIAAYALWLPFCAVVMLVRRRGWRPMLGWLAAMAVFSAATAYWLLVVHGALGLQNTETGRFAENGLANLTSLSRNLDNLSFTVAHTFGIARTLSGIGLGAVAYLYARRRGKHRTLALGWLAVLLPPALICLLLTSSVELISQTDPYWHRIRYMLPAAMMLGLVWALAVAQISLLLPRRFALLLLALFLLYGVPAVAEDVALVRYFRQTHTLHNVWAWSDVNLYPADGKLLMPWSSALASAWNRPWSGYQGITTFDWNYDDAPSHSTPQQFFEDYGIGYLIVTDRDRAGVYNTPETLAFIDQLFPLKMVTAGEVEPFTTTFYRMVPPQRMTEATFGGQITLVGVDLTVTEAEIILRPFWNAPTVPTTNYSMFVHLRAGGSPVPIAQADGSPANERRLPVTWDDPQEVLIGQTVTLQIPADAAADDLSLAIGLYDFTTGTRLTLDDGADAYVMGLAR